MLRKFLLNFQTLTNKKSKGLYLSSRTIYSPKTFLSQRISMELMKGFLSYYSNSSHVRLFQLRFSLFLKSNHKYNYSTILILYVSMTLFPIIITDTLLYLTIFFATQNLIILLVGSAITKLQISSIKNNIRDHSCCEKSLDKSENQTQSNICTNSTKC